MRKKVLIMGAAGKDFHVFNTCFRDRSEFEVVVFTATQIPNIDNRKYPAELAGPLYPQGIPIESENKLAELIKEHHIDQVIFSYSDVSYEYISKKEQIVRQAGADFQHAPVEKCMLPSTKPVIAVCAVRTGSGKSQTTRKVVEILKSKGKKVVVCRHPMPYGNLVKQRVQRFACVEDMDKHECTIEEREEYEHHILAGTVVFAGVDYKAILTEAEKEADVVMWDGGNNDIPFFKPDLHIVVVDPLRAGHELSYYPGKVNFELGHVLLFNKMDSAKAEAVESIMANIKKYNPNATIVKANSGLKISNPGLLKGKKVLCIEDGPTVTHGDMTIGAGVVASQRNGAKELVDPRPFLKGTLIDTFKTYPNIGKLLPAMGYGKQQILDLQETINACDCDVVVIATPIDLEKLVKVNKPIVRVTYYLDEITKPDLTTIISNKLHI
ncbi:MAG: GTPase [Candidatus Brocadiae bacterium]|nr:GTPase [Candidatus Brocadiia bacterium]